MTALRQPGKARLDTPIRIDAFPFAETIDVASARAGEHEPSPCLPAAASVWYRLAPRCAGSVVIDLAGSTPFDSVVRLYRQGDAAHGELEFIGCASPVWNGQLTLEAQVRRSDVILAQIGTSESRRGRIVVRAEFHR